MAVVLLIGALLLSFVPCLLLYFWLKNGMEDEERRTLCRKLLIGGVLCSFAVIACSGLLVLARNLLARTVLPMLGEDNLISAIYHNFLVLAFSEELVKGFTAWRIVKRNLKEFSWLDLIIAGAIVGIGFEMIESVVYVIESNPIQIIIRGVTALHAVYSMVLGYYLGKGLRTDNKGIFALAILVPVLLHGLYDFSLSDQSLAMGDFALFLPFIMIFVTLAIGIRIILLIRKIRRDKDGEYLEPLPISQ